MPDILPLVLIVLVLTLAVLLLRLYMRRSEIVHTEARIIRAFEDKANKIPALVEIMRKHTKKEEIFEPILTQYERAILRKSTTVFDLLEINARLQEDLLFLFRMSMKVRGIQRDGSFVYVRDFFMFLETTMRREIEDYGRLARSYNRIRRYKNFTILGLLIPIGDMIEIG